MDEFHTAGLAGADEEESSFAGEDFRDLVAMSSPGVGSCRKQSQVISECPQLWGTTSARSMRENFS